MTMRILATCPRCRGQIVQREDDRGGPYPACLQCGHEPAPPRRPSVKADADRLEAARRYIVARLAAGGPSTTHMEIGLAVGVSPASAERYVNKLVALGRLRRVYDGHRTRLELPKEIIAQMEVAR